MANLDLYIKVENKPEIIRKLEGMKGEKARMVMQRTMSDMRVTGPSIIATVVSQRYDIAQGKVNPNSRANRMHKSGSRGKVSMAGTLASITFVYTGRMLAIGGGATAREGSFSLTPRSVGYNKRQEFKTRILRAGGKKPVGHWAKPYSEGGRYGSQSPHMPLPGIHTPSQRSGKKWGRADKGPSIPAMVHAEPTQAQYMPLLENALMLKCQRHLPSIV